MGRKNLISWMVMLFLVMVWGSSFILMKKGLVAFNPYQVAAARIMFAFFVLAIPALFFMRKYKFRDIMLATLSGLIGNVIPAFLFTAAQRHIDSYVAGILNSTTTLFTLIIGVVFFAYKTFKIQVAGVIIGFAGVAGLLISIAGNTLNVDIAYGSLILIATVMYAVNVNLIKTYMSHIRSVHLACMMIFIPGILLSLYFSFTDPFWSVVFTDMLHAESAMYILILGVFGTAVSTVLYYYLIKISGIVFATSVTYMMPVVALLWGLADGEHLRGIYVFFIGIIILGVIFASNSIRLLKAK